MMLRASRQSTRVPATHPACGKNTAFPLGKQRRNAGMARTAVGGPPNAPALALADQASDAVRPAG